MRLLIYSLLASLAQNLQFFCSLRGIFVIVLILHCFRSGNDYHVYENLLRIDRKMKNECRKNNQFDFMTAAPRSLCLYMWLSHFANGISKDNIEKHVVSTGNYLWHVFSWELLDKKCF